MTSLASIFQEEFVFFVPPYIWLFFNFALRFKFQYVYYSILNNTSRFHIFLGYGSRLLLFFKPIPIFFSILDLDLGFLYLV